MWSAVSTPDSRQNNEKCHSKTGRAPGPVAAAPHDSPRAGRPGWSESTRPRQPATTPATGTIPADAPPPAIPAPLQPTRPLIEEIGLVLEIPVGKHFSPGSMSAGHVHCPVQGPAPRRLCCPPPLDFPSGIPSSPVGPPGSDSVRSSRFPPCVRSAPRSGPRGRPWAPLNPVRFDNAAAIGARQTR